MTVTEAAIWNVALSDAEVARLAQPGVLPTDIHPASLVWYPPVWGAE